jgi:cytochrome c peroxidase
VGRGSDRTVAKRLLPLLAVAALAGCTKADFVGKPESIRAPLGLPAVPGGAPAAAVALGRKLFFSPSLSVDGTLACASCHQPGQGFADPRPNSPGVNGGRGNRNAPSVWNAAYWSSQFWDGRAATLEQQASGPMMNPVEMGHSSRGVVAAVAADPEFRRLMAAAYGDEAVTLERITKAIAAFEKTLVRGNSPFDRYQFGGDRTALSEQAQRGLALFRNKARCALCHTIAADHALLTDQKFHNLGVGMDPAGNLPDPGRYAVTGREADRGAFRTPSLRNIAETAPYMHDGSLKSLKEVVDFYVGGGNANPQLDPLLQPLTSFTREERSDLVAFLESLTGETVANP